MSLHRLSRALATQPRHSVYSIACIPSHNLRARCLATSTPPGPLNDPQSSPSHAPTVDAQQLSHLKHPKRGGRNLTRRYKRLERSLRGKNVYGREIESLQRSGEVTDPAPYTSEEKTQQANSSTGRSKRRIFRGFVVPEAPKPPAEDECCMSGCAVCVYDLYDEAREDYIKAVDHLRSELKKLSVPESEWPADVRPDWKGGQTSPVSRPDVVYNAFEQLERALKAKKEKEAQPPVPSVSAQSREG
ncbi:hypothetical protein K466DRAFT_548601 [Polyporus arcularius HHB13444]|uniref:Oxidoreductase-like domain-containing protein n=1 Tax=Polyporus arcularius HHB13444 TaxID=1314778 RepID=A0A5C3PCP0_9APHY|nr:hypothetical protein K466DRAFT_548601 [Polyporus arcularius HHB13444]